MSMQFITKANEKIKASIPMCDLKDGQVAKVIETAEYVICVQNRTDRLFLILESSSKQNSYHGNCMNMVSLIEKDDSVTIRFFNQ